MDETTRDNEQLNELIAERVFGWVRWTGPTGFPCFGTEGGGHRDVPDFSSDIAAAWLVVEAVTRPPRTVAEAERAANTRFAFWWDKANLWAESASDASRRICLAALEATGAPHAK